MRDRLLSLWRRRWRPSAASTPQLRGYLLACLALAALSFWSLSGGSSLGALLPTALFSALALEALWILLRRRRSGR